MKSKKQGTLKRVIKMLFEFYPVLMPLVVVCVLLNAGGEFYTCYILCRISLPGRAELAERRLVAVSRN